jgi:hypothetical protein
LSRDRPANLPHDQRLRQLNHYEQHHEHELWKKKKKKMTSQKSPHTPYLLITALPNG